GDALRIAYQNRPRLFDRHIVLPEMLYSKVIEVDERFGARGEVVLPLDAGRAKADLQAAYADGYRSIAIVFMHGYRFTAHEQRVAGVRMRAPMMSIHTVAAGGGSILHFDGARYRVGPDSAGAHPGPACYRRGGPLTVTDANVMLGKIQPAFFPAVFGPQGDRPLDAEVVAQRFGELTRKIGDGR